jgi:DNA primase
LVRREGRDAFEQRLGESALLSDYLFDHLTAELDLSSAEGRAKLDGEARTLIQAMPAGTFRGLLEERLRGLVGLSASAPRRWRPTQVQAGRGLGGAPRPLTPMRLALALLLDQPALALRADEQPADWQSIDNPGVALLREVIDRVRADPQMTPALLCERWRDHQHAPVIRRLSDSGLIAHIPVEGREAEFIGALARLNQEARREQRWRMLQDVGRLHSADAPRPTAADTAPDGVDEAKAAPQSAKPSERPSGQRAEDSAPGQVEIKDSDNTS